MLEQRPLRDSVTAASGIGESFAVPKDTESLAEISRALGVLLGREGRRRVVERLAEQAGVDLSPAACWVLARMNEDPRTDLAAASSRFQVPLPVAEKALVELEERGMVLGAPVAAAGAGTSPVAVARARADAGGDAAVAKLIAARRESLARLLDGWSPDQPSSTRRC